MRRRLAPRASLAFVILAGALLAAACTPGGSGATAAPAAASTAPAAASTAPAASMGPIPSASGAGKPGY